MYTPYTYIIVPKKLSIIIQDLLLTIWVTKLKLDINLVDVHLQISHIGHLVDDGRVLFHSI
jgi:hypothetical protein